jgi:beta-lactamase regulating signal transducer with metallopeptidase domain
MPGLFWIGSNILLASLLALAAWLMQRWLRRPAFAHILWVLVLVKLVTPPLVIVPFRQFAGILACTIGICGCGKHSPTQNLVGETFPWILLVAWSIGAAATGWTAWRRWTRFRRLLANAVPAPPEWQTLAARLSTELSLRSPPEILAVPGRLPPLVVPGRQRPSMLLPTDLMGRLNDSQRTVLVLHELIHIQRRDHLVRMLELSVSVVYWWLPLVGSIGRQLRDCEEACCDEAVVAHQPHARRDYARLLLDVIDFASPLPQQSVPQATAMSAAHYLERRLRTILDATSESRRAWPAASFVAGACGLALACILLPCELQCDFMGLPGPEANSAEQEPDAGETCAPGGTRRENLSLSLCCPS